MKNASRTLSILLRMAGTAATLVWVCGPIAAQAIPLPPAPPVPQAPSATVTSYGAYNSGTYLYGPLSKSGNSAVSVTNVPNCGGPCSFISGPAYAYGAAHASPGGDMGVYSSIGAADGTPSHPYNSYLTDSVVGDSEATLANSGVVTSSTLSTGTPVQFSVTMRLDGNVDLSYGDLQTAGNSDGGYISSSTVSGEFYLYDPTIMGTGETASIPQNLIDFTDNIYGENASLWDSVKGKYVVEQQSNKSWSLTSNHGDNLGNATNYYCDGETQDCGSISGASGATAFTGHPLGFNFDTGVQTVTLDTYVGATLDWNANMYMFNQAYGATAVAVGDFSHTFGVNLNPITPGVALNFSSPQQPLFQPSSVPEPPAMLLLASGLLALAGVYRRRRRR